MAWAAVADVPFVPVGTLYFSQIIGAEFYMVDRGFNFYRYHIGTGVWTQLANTPFIGTGIYRSLAYRNGMLYCIDDDGAGWGGLRISWYNPATDVWASSAQVPFVVSGYRRIRSFCFADNDTIWAWVQLFAGNRVKCVRYVISTDTWTEFANDTGVLAVAQARSAAINAAGTMVYCGEMGAAAGRYGRYTIAGDLYWQSGAPPTARNYCWVHDPQRLWYYPTGVPIVNMRYGYFDIEALAYNDDYWEAGPPSRTAIAYLGSDLEAIVCEAQAIAGPQPWVWWNGLIVPTVQTDPATEIK